MPLKKIIHPEEGSSVPPDLIGFWLADISEALRERLGVLSLDWELDLSGSPRCLRANDPESGTPLGRLEFKVNWPRAADEAAGDDQVIVNKVYEPSDEAEKTALLNGDAALATATIGEMRDTISNTMARIFPRDSDGAIDWRKSGPGAAKAAGTGDANAYLTLNVSCNLECLFCSRSAGKPQSVPPPIFFLDQVMVAARDIPPAREGAVFKIGGDEPMLHPDLPSLIALGAARGYGEIELCTSAAGLLTPEACSRLAQKGLTRVQIPLYGTTASTHDSIVGAAGHFNDTLSAIRNCSGAGIAVNVHSVILKQNLGEAPVLEKFVREQGAAFVRFIFPQVEGPSRFQPGEFIPGIFSIPKSVRRSITRLFIPCAGIGVRQDALPEIRPFARGDYPLEKPAKCARCSCREACTGVVPEYLKIYGEDEFNPVEKPCTEDYTPSGPPPLGRLMPPDEGPGRPRDLLAAWLMRIYPGMQARTPDLNLDWEMDLSGATKCLRAFEPGSGKHWGTLEFKINRPQTAGEPAIDGQVLFRKTAEIAGSDDGWGMWESDAFEIINILTGLLNAFPDAAQDIFPRDKNGAISWNEIGFEAPDPGVEPCASTYHVTLDTGCRRGVVFCAAPSNGRTGAGRMVLMEQVMAAAKTLPKATGDAALKIGGDEPFFHPELKSMVALGIARGYRRIEISTGAAPMINPKTCAQMAEMGVTGVRMPLYGTSPAVHDSIAGQDGHFAATLAAVENLEKAGIDVGIFSVRLERNSAETDGLEKFARERGLKFEGFVDPVE